MCAYSGHLYADRVTVLKLDHLHTKHGTCRTSDLHRTHWFSQHDVRSQITDRVTVLKLDHLHTKHGTCRTSDLHRTHWTGRRPRSPDAVRTTHNTRHRSPPTTCGTRSARLRTTPHGSAARLRAHRTLTAVGTSRRRRLGDGCRPRRLTAPHGTAAQGSAAATA